MTREEAVKMLNRLMLYCNECPHNNCEKCVEAINTAIEALENSQNCVKCIHYYETEDERGVHSHCEQEPMRGKWLPENADVPSYCSVCGHSWDEYIHGPEVCYTGDLPHFCPNCGARMESDEE